MNGQGKTGKRRTKERFVGEAKDLVERWRSLFERRHFFRGEVGRLTLDECASRIGISRKSLEDYYYLFKKAAKLGIDVETYRQEKMGVLRKRVKREVEIDANQMENISQMTQEEQSPQPTQPIQEIGFYKHFESDLEYSHYDNFNQQQSWNQMTNEYYKLITNLDYDQFILVDN